MEHEVDVFVFNWNRFEMRLHLKMIPIKDKYKNRYGPDYGRPDKENKLLDL